MSAHRTDRPDGGTLARANLPDPVRAVAAALFATGGLAFFALVALSPPPPSNVPLASGVEAGLPGCPMAPELSDFRQRCG